MSNSPVVISETTNNTKQPSLSTSTSSINWKTYIIRSIKECNKLLNSNDIWKHIKENFEDAKNIEDKEGKASLSAALSRIYKNTSSESFIKRVDHKQASEYLYGLSDFFVEYTDKDNFQLKTSYEYEA